jgi:hypothetical protein
LPVETKGRPGTFPPQFHYFEADGVSLLHSKLTMVAMLLLLGLEGSVRADLVMELAVDKLAVVQGEQIVVNVFLRTNDGSSQSLGVLDYEVAAGPYDNSGKGGSFLSGVNAIFTQSPAQFDLSSPGISYFTDYGRQDNGTADELLNGSARKIGTLQLNTTTATPGNYQLRITFQEAYKRTLLTGGAYKFDFVNTVVGPSISYSISPIPEPSSVLLCGGAFLWWRSWRRKPLTFNA